MSEFSKKVSYLRGYAEGMELDSSSPEGKLILKMLDVMDEMAAAVNSIQDELDVLREDIELNDELVDDVYSQVFSDDDEIDDDALFDDYDTQDDLYEMECPNCHEDVMIEFDMINDDNAIVCPNCHKEIPLEFDFDEDYED